MSSGSVPARVPWVAVVVFVVFSFGLAWLVTLPMWLSGEGLATPASFVLITAMMLTPAVATFIAGFVVQHPRPERLGEYLGVWPLRPVKRTLLLSLAGLLGSVALVALGIALSGVLGLVKLDLVHFSGFRAQLDALGGADAAGAPPIGVLVVLQLLSIPFAAIFINSFFAFGEELGWRGWLLQSLRPLGTWPALIVTGVIWGLWHSPVILLGYNFGHANLFGVVLMVIGCVFFGILLGWLRLRSGSVWPAVFAHAAFNGSAGLLALVIAVGETPDPAAVGPLGWVSWVIMAVVVAVLVARGQFSKQPPLERRPLPYDD